jgi:hypothetical protein
MEMEKRHRTGDRASVISLGKQARIDLALLPELSPLHRRWAGTLWDRMGSALSSLNKHEDAVECYEELVAHYATSIDSGASLLQGRALMLLGGKMEECESNSVRKPSNPPTDHTLLKKRNSGSRLKTDELDKIFATNDHKSRHTDLNLRA